MHQSKIEWVSYAVVVLALGVGGVLFGYNLLPEMSVAEERGVVIPWMLTWAMVWMTLVTAIVIAWYVIRTGGGPER